MGNLNYKRSRKREYLVQKKYESEGWFVVRSAGSHGVADLIAIRLAADKCADPSHYQVKFIQIKVSEKLKIFKETIEAVELPFGIVNVEFLKFPVKSKKYYGRYRKTKAKKRAILSSKRIRPKRLEAKPYRLRSKKKSIPR